MLNKPLFLVPVLLVSTLGVSAHAATMSSDVAQSGILDPSVEMPQLATAMTGEGQEKVKTQASAYFSPAGDAAVSAKQDNKKDAVALTGGTLALGSFFLQSSSGTDYPSVVITSPALETSAGVAPVPELNTMTLMLVAMVGLMGAAWLRKKKEDASHAPVRLPVRRG